MNTQGDSARFCLMIALCLQEFQGILMGLDGLNLPPDLLLTSTESMPSSHCNGGS